MSLTMDYFLNLKLLYANTYFNMDRNTGESKSHNDFNLSDEYNLVQPRSDLSLHTKINNHSLLCSIIVCFFLLGNINIES